MPAPPLAVIFGAGPGTGAALAKALAPTHSLLLLSRSLPASLPSLNLPASLSSDRLLAFKYDSANSAASFQAALAQAKAKWPDAKLDVAICHASVPFAPGPFLEQQTERDLRPSLESVTQAWDFSQTVIPHMLPAGGTLLFTGATMARRGSAGFAASASGAFGRRALAQSLAREFGPQGIHVAHIIVDGLIETDRVKGMRGESQPGERLDPEAIAQTYMAVIDQPPSCWTQEMDIRPAKEKW